MNEETDTPETLDAVLAEMREWSTDENDALARYADRIEAAAKREYEEAKVYFEKLHAGPSMICTAKNCAVRNIGLSLAAAPRKFDESAPGNAAALIVDAVNERDRLRDIVRRLLMLRRGDIAVPMDMEKQILAEARAALGEGETPTGKGVG